MAKIPTDQQTHPFHFRPGTDPLANLPWRLVNTEDDPGSLDPNELQWGENIRRRGKGIGSRPGVEEVVDLGTAAGSIFYFGALPVDYHRTRLWMSTLGAYTGSTLTGSGLIHYDPTEPLPFQHHSHYFRTADHQMPIGKYGTRIFIGDKSVLRELVDVRGPYGVEAIEATPSPPTAPVAIFPGFSIRSLQEFDGLLFVGLENVGTPASSKIVAWNGLSAQNDITGVRPPLSMGIHRNTLVVGFDATAAHIRVRQPGAVPGTWATHALAGFLSGVQGNVMAEHGDSIFIASGTTLIHKFDGTNLTLVRTIAGAAADGSGITALATHRGVLYYGWNLPDPWNSRLGRYDPDSSANDWVDTYVDLTAVALNFKRLSSMASYRGQLYFGGRQATVIATAENDVMGAPEIVHDTGVPTTDFRVMQMLRF